MPRHSETKHLPYTPEQLFDLVADVARYDEFLPWVVAVRVRSSSDEETVADLVVRRLLEAGVRIFEYSKAMIHAKMLIVDETWAVLGTTNIDNRSFEHNDEVNIVMRDEAIARRLIADYTRDAGESREITLESWQRRPLWEKMIGRVAWILERQQ